MGVPVSRVAVVGADDPLASRLCDAVRTAGGKTVAPGSADAVVAVGDDAVRESMLERPFTPDRGTDPPVFPVRDGPHAADQPSVPDVVGRLLEAGGDRVSHPVLSVILDGDPVGRAAFDVGFVTTEPARISEYAVELPGGRTENVRADGVVAATPLGSTGYASAAGGPILEPGSGVSVVPIAPFTTRSDTWVVPDGLRVSVERDAEPVSLVVDGSRRELVAPGRPIRIEVAGRVDAVVTSHSPRVDPHTDRKGSNNS